MTVKEILSEFDVEGKNFDLLSNASIFNSCDETEKNSVAYRAEVLAFELIEGYKSDMDIYDGKFYFGPCRVYQDTATGKFIEYPTRSHISSDVISYWEKRINVAKNSILKARYAGLVWEFKTFVTHEKCDIQIARIYIKALIYNIENNLYSQPILGVKQSERIIKLSKKLNQLDLLENAKSALRILMSKHDKSDSIAIWSSAYRISTECEGSYSNEEQEALVTELENRFEHLYKMPVCGDERKTRNPWVLMDLADLLSGYYKKHSPDKIEIVFDKVEVSFDAIKDKMTKLQLLENYSRLHRFLNKYGLRDKASMLSVKISELGEGAQDEMQVFRHEFSVPREKIEVLINYIFHNDNIESLFGRFTYYFIPKREKEKQILDRLVKDAPFMYMIRESLFDDRGREKAVVEGIGSDYEGHLILHISESMHFETIYINTILEEGKLRGIFTKDNILSFITKSPSIKEDRIPVIAKALESYFKGDYLVFIHLLIPQIEEAVRTLLKIGRIPVLKPNNSGNGFQYRTLDDILRDSDVQMLLTEDFANYLRILLTDNRGWNLRNEVCHGIAPFNLFNKMTADRLFHILLCLGVFREKA